MIGKCKRCGQCCENVQLIHSPKDLKTMYEDWYFERKGKAKFENIYLIFPMLHFKHFNSRIKRFVYSCLHFSRNKKDLAVCNIYKWRPKMCKGFPWYDENKIKMNLKPVKPSQYRGCGYNE